MADASIDITGGAGRQKVQPQPPGNAQRQTDQMAEQLKPLFLYFLNQFSLPSSGSTGPVNTSSSAANNGENTGKLYVDRAHACERNSQTTIQVDFAHISSFQSELADAIREHHYRVMPFLAEAVQQFMKEHAPNHTGHKVHEANSFRPGFYNLPAESTIRDLKTGRIGQLMSIKGTVTRTSAVRPELASGTFRCLDCRTICANIVQQFKYTEPNHCLNPVCENRARWSLETSLSTFQDWQLVRIQENSNEIPPGSMPRSMKIVLRNEEVEKAKPGDKCTFVGTLIVVPDVSQLGGNMGGPKFAKGGGSNARDGTADGVSNAGVGGLKELGVRDLTYSLCFLASSVKTGSNQMGEVTLDENGNPLPDQELFTPIEMDRIHCMKAQGRLYTRMVASIAPNIFGHDEIKRGVLLMLLGGVHKKTSDGQNLRGDINVCIVGDPSTSKSQFLKYVCTFLPRAVYTSGKASSAAGLTASVARDPETGEFAIEAGALMLADNGICCIDEFDKMEAADQVAIHEAMEQQTISIAKAGIQATLNARTSILAAANPIKGRYDPSRTLKQNVDISAPIMSRFDLFFVVLDEGDQAIDYNIARHIVNVHTGKPTYTRPEFSLEDLQLYIRYARTLKPAISEAAKRDFVENYCQLRGADSTGSSKSAYRITVRQLESMVRLAEARARLDLELEVTPSHVKEAARLLKKSIVHVENRDVDLEDDDGEAEYDLGGGAEGGDDDDNGGDDENGGSGRGRKVVGGSKFQSKKAQAVRQDQEERKDGGSVAQDERPEDAMETEEGAAAESAEGAASGKAKVTLSFTEYQRLTLLLVRFMRARETAANPSMSWHTLVNEFIGTAAGGEAPNTEEELIAQTRTLELVIHRLIKVDHILLLLRKSKDKTKRMLKVHPNFTGESMDASGIVEEEPTVDPFNEPAADEEEAAKAIREQKAARAASPADEAQPMEEEEAAPATPLSRRSNSKAATPAKTPSSGRSQRSNK